MSQRRAEGEPCGQQRASAAIPRSDGRAEGAVWTPLELVRWTQGYFERAGIPSARLDAELLLAHVLERKRIDLYLDFERPVEAAERARYRELVRSRAESRVPVAYLTGEREFWSHSFAVTPDVLIPRPETETLVRVACALAPRRVVEVGPGSGAVCAAIAIECPEARIVAVEHSRAALRVARANLARLELEDRVQLVAGDGLEPIASEVDLIVSNPPYLRDDELDGLAPELGHEPRTALCAGPDGLELIRRLCADAPPRLRSGGHLALEIGAGQRDAVEALLRQAGARDVELEPDLAGVDRVVTARFGS